MSLELVYRNFVWRIERTQPVDTSRVVGRFASYDPLVDAPDSGSGWHRRFYVEWQGSTGDEEATDLTHREADHVFRVNVIYAATEPYDRLVALIARDRHVLIKALRDHRYLDGISDALPAQDTGQIGPRRHTRDAINREPGIMRLTIDITTRIREGEN